MTTSSFEKIIVRVNSTQRRTHADVARIGAPANAIGANTAAMISIALRKMNIAHTKNDAITYPIARMSINAGDPIEVNAAVGAISRPSLDTGHADGSHHPVRQRVGRAQQRGDHTN